ncbi:MAG: hypothetical protein ACOZNI_21200 [Myxococcota bacterium]
MDERDEARANLVGPDDMRVGAGVNVSQVLLGESRVAPCRFLGINKGRYPHRDEDNVDTFGRALEILADVARAGGGIIRQVENCDLLWSEIYPDDVIPSPKTIESRLTSGDFEDLASFTLLLLGCAVLDVQIVPTLFMLGGGSDANDDPTKAFEGVENATAITDALQSASPNHEVKAAVPTIKGWSSFYWDPDEVGVEPEKISERRDKEAQKLYQQFALNVYADGQTEYFMGEYNKSCARRKSLALAAFGAGIGTYFAELEKVLAILGLDFTDVIPYIECGNEMEVCWLTKEPDDGTPSSAMDASCTTEPDACSGLFYADDDLYYGARELATFHAMLAGPVRLACPSARFRAAGLASATSEEEWCRRKEWMYFAMGTGLSEVVSFWNGLGSDIDCLVDAGEFDEYCFTVEEYDGDRSEPQKGVNYWWLKSCFEADYYWPPLDSSLSFSAKKLVHQVGFHWYHSWDDGLDDSQGYLPQADLLAHCDDFVEEVVERLTREFGLTLTWDVSEVGFHAEKPPEEVMVASRAEVDAGGDPTARWNTHATPEMQAGMLFRYVVSILSRGPEMLLWHTFMSRIAERGLASGTEIEGWTIFAAMGVRVDAIDTENNNFDRERHAFRRPSWYAFRRLVWLLQETSTISVLVNDGNAMLLRLRAADAFRSSIHDSYRYAYLAWVDQQASEGTRLEFTLDLSEDASYTRVATVPKVAYPDTTSPDTDDVNFPTGETVTWLVGAFSTATVREYGMGRFRRLEITVERADGDSNPAPVCILTSARLATGMT